MYSEVFLEFTDKKSVISVYSVLVQYQFSVNTMLTALIKKKLTDRTLNIKVASIVSFI